MSVCIKQILDKPIGGMCVHLKCIFRIGLPEQHTVPGNFYTRDGCWEVKKFRIYQFAVQEALRKVTVTIILQTRLSS